VGGVCGRQCAGVGWFRRSSQREAAVWRNSVDVTRFDRMGGGMRGLGVGGEERQGW
jgi:hypothetical protein